MNAPHNSAQAHAWRKRTAAVFAAVGALIFSSGIVMLSAPAANAADKIGVCHRNASTGYGFIEVSEAAFNNPNNGHASHLAGEPGSVPGFPDYILGSPGVPPEVETNAELETWCLTRKLPVALPTLSVTYITACAGTGSVTRPTDTGLVTYSIEGGAWSGLEGDVDVVATLTDLASGFKSPAGAWTVSGRTATQTVHFGSSSASCTQGTVGDLGITMVGDCGSYGSIVAPSNPVNVTYSIEGGSWTHLSGEYDVVATLANGASSFTALPSGWSLTSPTTAKRTVDVGTYAACVDPSVVTPLEPQWVEAKCDTDAGVVYTAVTGVSYATTGSVMAGQTVTVTATALNGDYVLKTGVPASWEHSFTAKPVGAACGGGSTPTPVTPKPEPQPTLVTPSYPSATDADCSHDGQLVVPAQPAGVLTTRSGAAPGEVTFTFAPAAGYAFPAGTATTTTVTVAERLSGEDCILGVESVKPKPHTTQPKPHTSKSKPKPRDRAPIVLGTQAAVPTAVDAGLAGLPSASVSPTSSPRLAQALVAGGLLMLVAGGSLGLGRRPRGAHES